MIPKLNNNMHQFPDNSVNIHYLRFSSDIAAPNENFWIDSTKRGRLTSIEIPVIKRDGHETLLVL